MIRHRVPAAMLASLSEGKGGPEAIRHLSAAEYSKNLLLVQGVVAAARESAHPQHGRARDAYDLLASVQEYVPGAVNVVLRYPSVGAWAGRTLLSVQKRQPCAGAEPACLAAVAAAAAVRARFPCALEVPVTHGAITLPSLGQVAPPVRSDTALLRSWPDGSEILAARARVLIPDDPHLDAPGWLGVRRIRASSRGVALRPVMDDVDPYRLQAASLATRLTEEEVQRWRLTLREAWDVLCSHHMSVAEEISAAIRVIVPLRRVSYGIRSATSRENFGSVGISAPPTALDLAVALTHEVQHVKLSALQGVVRLTRSDDSRRYYAPWQDHPRPVSGLLQGTYAYLGVARFWRRQRHEEKGAEALRAHAEYARWRSAVLTAAEDLLNGGQLTAVGQRFVSGMVAAVQDWRDDPIPVEAAGIARRAAALHAEYWSVRYGPLR